MKRGKNYLESLKVFDKNTQYDTATAIENCLQTAKAKFDETIEVSVRLGVDPRHADQQVRGTVILPNGTGKTQRVLVFARGEKAAEAMAAGADYVGDMDLVHCDAGHDGRCRPHWSYPRPERLDAEPQIRDGYDGCHQGCQRD